MTENKDSLSLTNKELPSDSVAKDLIKRLESRLPPSKLTDTLLLRPTTKGPSYMSTEEFENKFRSLADETQKLKEEFDKKIAELSAQSVETPQPSNSLVEAPHLKVGDEEAAYNAVKELEKIVNCFNTNMEEWYKSTGCEATFSWVYNPHKKLQVSSIDLIVFRKKAPSALSIKEALDQMPEDKTT